MRLDQTDQGIDGRIYTPVAHQQVPRGYRRIPFGRRALDECIAIRMSREEGVIRLRDKGCCQDPETDCQLGKNLHFNLPGCTFRARRWIDIEIPQNASKKPENTIDRHLIFIIFTVVIM